MKPQWELDRMASAIRRLDRRIKNPNNSSRVKELEGRKERLVEILKGEGRAFDGTVGLVKYEGVSK